MRFNRANDAVIHPDWQHTIPILRVSATHSIQTRSSTYRVRSLLGNGLKEGVVGCSIVELFTLSYLLKLLFSELLLLLLLLTLVLVVVGFDHCTD